MCISSKQANKNATVNIIRSLMFYAVPKAKAEVQDKDFAQIRLIQVVVKRT